MLFAFHVSEAPQVEVGEDEEPFTAEQGTPHDGRIYFK
jgi:hypothetical protein